MLDASIKQASVLMPQKEKVMPSIGATIVGTLVIQTD